MGKVYVKMFGVLHTFRKDQGLPSEAEVEVPDSGITAKLLAENMGLPLDMIEGVFLDHRIHPLSIIVNPGDSIAYAPRGIPGPHRFTLGIYHAGKG
jgi:hypothetical protein